jgi:hypothetical protein
MAGEDTMKLYEIFADCANCCIERPEMLPDGNDIDCHISGNQIIGGMLSYYNKYRKIRPDKINMDNTRAFMNAARRVNELELITPETTAENISITAQIIIHLYLIASRLKELTAAYCHSYYRGDFLYDFLCNVMRVRDLLSRKLRKNPDAIRPALVYIYTETVNTKYEKHFIRLTELFADGLIYSRGDLPLSILAARRHRTLYAEAFLEVLNKKTEYNSDEIEKQKNFMDFEEIMSLRNAAELMKSPIRYKISRYMEFDYSCENPHRYMQSLDCSIAAKDEKTTSLMIENILMAMEMPNYPADLWNRLVGNFGKIPNDADLCMLFNRAKRQH